MGATTNHIWDNSGNIVYEYGTKGETAYNRGLGGEIISAGDNYYAYNGHGDTTNLLSKDKDSVNVAFNATYDYDAFGNLTENTGSEADNNPFRYNGQYTDDETGLLYLRNRYYDPSIGRFTQEDPAKDGLNWYVYCANDPINFIDPSGNVAYELFSSPDAAAEDWAWNYYAKTDFSRYEQLSIIYKLTDGENTYYTYGSAVDIIDFGGTDPHFVVPSAAYDFKPTDLGMEAEQYSFVHSHPSEQGISDLDKEFVTGDYGGFSSVYAVVRNEFDPNLVDVQVYHDTRANGYCTEVVISNLRYDRSYLTEERRESIKQRYESAWYDHVTNNLIDGIYCYDGQDCPTRMWPNNRW